MENNGTTVLPQSMEEITKTRDFKELWDLIKGNDASLSTPDSNGKQINNLQDACSHQSGILWGNNKQCDNIIFCFYSTASDKYVFPLGKLTKLSFVKQKPNRIFTLAFSQLPEIQSFDNLEIKISEKNLSRIRYVFIQTTAEENKRKSMATKLRNSGEDISKKLADESAKVSEGFSAVGNNFIKDASDRTNATRTSLANSFTSFGNSIRPANSPLIGGKTDGGKKKTIRKNKKRKLSLRKK
jgi:hypothetical protein